MEIMSIVCYVMINLQFLFAYNVKGETTFGSTTLQQINGHG